VQLAHQLTGTGTDPDRVAVLVHGIMGSGRNWAGWARRLATLYPQWRFVVVDLRGHGDSQAPQAPHTLQACVADLEETFAAIGLRPRLAIGHSFGGKVVALWACGASSGPPLALVLDAVPFEAGDAPLDDEVAGVVRAVASLRPPLQGYDQVRAAFVSRGFSDMLAGWMTTNVRRDGDAFTWRFDLDVVRELLDSYLVVDLTEAIESSPGRVTLIRAGRSSRWTPSLVGRLGALQGVEIRVMPDAGHWLHVDDPAGLLQEIGRLIEVHTGDRARTSGPAG
jgi:pimeloyl-ACP methyl ester carboxylesterase